MNRDTAWRPSLTNDLILNVSGNQSVDYQQFRAQYVNLRSQYSETFQNKVFAEKVVFNGKQMRLTDESTYELVHSKLNALEISDDAAMSMMGKDVAVIESSSQVKQGNSTVNLRSNVKTTQA